VNLERLYIDPSVEYIIDSDVAELVEMTKQQVKAKKWDNEDEIIKAIDEETGKVEMVDFWGWDEDEYVHEIYVNTDEDDKEKVVAYRKVINTEDGVPKEFIYHDFHIGAYTGRFLRTGVVELLFEPQEMFNELVNRNRENQRIASLMLFRTGEEETYGNLLSGVENGEIINSNDLQQIAVTNRQYNEFVSQAQFIENYADKLLGTFGVIAGETPPSGTTFRGQAASINRAKQRFDFQKQYIWERFGELIKKDILPGVMKTWNNGGVINAFYGEDDIKFYDKMLKDAKKTEYLMTAEKDGRSVTMKDLEELDKRTQNEIESKGRKLVVPRKAFNFEYGFKITPTNESIDKAQKNDAMFNAIQMVLANPTVIDIPLFRQMLEDNGIAPFTLTAEQQQQIQQAGGGQTPKLKEPDKLSQIINE